MASSLWSWFQISHPAFCCVNTIQKVRRPVSSVVQVQQGRRDETILHRQKW